MASCDASGCIEVGTAIDIVADLPDASWSSAPFWSVMKMSTKPNDLIGATVWFAAFPIYSPGKAWASFWLVGSNEVRETLAVPVYGVPWLVSEFAGMVSLLVLDVSVTVASWEASISWVASAALSAAWA